MQFKFQKQHYSFQDLIQSLQEYFRALILNAGLKLRQDVQYSHTSWFIFQDLGQTPLEPSHSTTVVRDPW